MVDEGQDVRNQQESNISEELAGLQENCEALEADLQLKQQVVTQMHHGIALFEHQAEDEVALNNFKQREANILTNLIISAESLSVKLDQQVLAIVELVNQQSDLHSVLASIDPELTYDLEYVEEQKVRHQVVLRKFLASLSAQQPTH